MADILFCQHPMKLQPKHTLRILFLWSPRDHDPGKVYNTPEGHRVCRHIYAELPGKIQDGILIAAAKDGIPSWILTC